MVSNGFGKVMNVLPSMSFQALLLRPEGVSELNVAIREFLPLCPIQPATFLHWGTSQTPLTQASQAMEDVCAPVAYQEKEAV